MDEWLDTYIRYTLHYLIDHNLYMFGEWQEASAGGQISHNTFVDNPQYLLIVPGNYMVVYSYKNSRVCGSMQDYYKSLTY